MQQATCVDENPIPWRNIGGLSNIRYHATGKVTPHLHRDTASQLPFVWELGPPVRAARG